ncbi:hypothetical protein VitviT2T_028853 [Vitis vinifera]|uniref:SAC3/GANP/THP3 conserved domain-containing protein n=3 Tax=Vitis vinifera TaxID=29760 RepID=A0ABY9DV98_VITVI
MCFARRLLKLFWMGNYKRFLCTTATEASYLQYYIIEPYINEVRALALSCVNYCGYKLHPYPIAHLSKLLMMKELDVESFLMLVVLRPALMNGEISSYQPSKQTSIIPRKSFQATAFWVWNTFRGNNQLELVTLSNFLLYKYNLHVQPFLIP